MNAFVTNKKFILYILVFVCSVFSFSQKLFAQEQGPEEGTIQVDVLQNYYLQFRENIRAGHFAELSTITSNFLLETGIDHTLLAGGTMTPMRFRQISHAFVGELQEAPNENMEDILFNRGMLGMAGHASNYFFKEAIKTDNRVKNFMNLFGYALQAGLIGQIEIPANALEEYYHGVFAKIIEASQVALWKGNHTDSYDYQEAQRLIPVFALLSEEFGADFHSDFVTSLPQETQALLVSRELGSDEQWTEPLDIIADIVRFTTRSRRPHYHKTLDTRDYFFFIQDHFARIFGAEDVDDRAEIAMRIHNNDHRDLILICNSQNVELFGADGRVIRLNEDPNTRYPGEFPGSSLLMRKSFLNWNLLSRHVATYRCGEKVYNVDTSDERFNIIAPNPTIVRPTERHRQESFNIVLSYVYFDNMPPEVVENLIQSMTEGEHPFRLHATSDIQDSRQALLDAISEADMFYRVGHVKGNNLNLSFRQGRELHFKKDYNGVEVNLKLQIPQAVPTGRSNINREELARALWNRKQNGKDQSLFTMGIACRSASFINTWMDGYFESVITHLEEATLLNEEGANVVQDFPPPFVMGATNAFSSMDHRNSAEGLNAFLKLVLIPMEIILSDDPAYEDPDLLKTTIYQALANNTPPYRAESNLETSHTGLQRRLNLVLSHEEEVIDRVYP